MDHHPTMRLLRRFFLLWIGLVYLGGCLTVVSRTIDITSCSDKTPGQCSLFFDLARTNISLLLVFTVLMALYGTLLWISLSTKSKRHVWLFCFFLQGALIFVIYLFLPMAEIALSLFLVLILEIIAVFELVRLAVCILLAAGYILLLLFLLAEQWIASGTNGKSLWLIILPSIPFYLAQILFLIGYLILYQQVARSHAQLAAAHKELEEAHRQLKVSAGRIEELTVLAERQRMARELHDTLAQGLTAVTMLVQGAHSHLTHQNYDQAQEIMQQTMKQAREILTMTRSTIDNLRSNNAHTIQVGHLIAEELSRFTMLTDTICKLEGPDLLVELPTSSQEHVRRFISEGLTNIARHAQARHVRIFSQENGQELILEIEDDGVGFVVAEGTARAGHYGLLGLAERARLVGGKLDLRSLPGQGTLLRLQIPLVSEENNDE